MKLNSPSPSQTTQTCTPVTATSAGDSENDCYDDPEALPSAVDGCVTTSSTEPLLTEESFSECLDQVGAGATDTDSLACGQ